MSTRQKRIRMNSRAARANWLYTSEDVQKLYQVTPNTVSNWIRYGLPYFPTKQRLFKGEHLNAFHAARNKAARQVCAKDEIYCLCCKQKHSLLQEPFEVQSRGRMRLEISIKCPTTGGEARSYISESVLDDLREQLTHNPSEETPD